MTTTAKIAKTCEDIKTLLLEKNANYGNSALQPLGVFSKLNAAEAIMARIDDKLARIRNKGLNDATEDTLDDLIGYLILLKIARGGASIEPKEYTTGQTFGPSYTTGPS